MLTHCRSPVAYTVRTCLMGPFSMSMVFLILLHFCSNKNGAYADLLCSEKRCWCKNKGPTFLQKEDAEDLNYKIDDAGGPELRAISLKKDIRRKLKDTYNPSPSRLLDNPKDS